MEQIFDKYSGFITFQFENVLGLVLVAENVDFPNVHQKKANFYSIKLAFDENWDMITKGFGEIFNHFPEIEFGGLTKLQKLVYRVLAHVFD